MTVLILGLVLLLGINSVSIVNPGWCAAVVVRRGEQVWSAVFALASLAGFVLWLHRRLIGRSPVG